MDKLKGVTKGGWHPPGKDGGKESWRKDFKGIGQAGWVGKGTGSDEPHKTRATIPRESLKDPATFRPPPKHIQYYGDAAGSNELHQESATGSNNSHQELEGHRGSLMKDIHVVETHDKNVVPPPVPYRAHRTGLSTSNVPKPPVRLMSHDTTSPTTEITGSKKPKPSLPPRLPPRANSGVGHGVQNSLPVTDTAVLEHTQEPYLNHGALDRLGAAGVSVPGLGIGHKAESTNPWQNEQSPSTDHGSRHSSFRAPAMGDLQSRFAQMTSSAAPSASPSQGTTLAQKQAALKTASSFKNDPSSVTLSDAKLATSTVQNFHERHGDQVAAGWQGASSLNKKYGITNRLGAYGSDGTPSANPSIPSTPVSPGLPSPSMQGARSPRSNPPKRIPAVGGSDPAPPPVPFASKPRP